MISSVPRTHLPQAVLPPGTGAVSESEPPYPEPEFSRPLLFVLLAILTLAQIGFEGIRFGLQNSQHGLVLPLLNFLHDPQVARGDILHLLAPYWASPFWSLLAAFDTSAVDRSLLFAAITVVARWAAAVAVFRISERSFGHPLAALLAAVLWLGLPSVGGAFLHRDFLAPGDVALALSLWAIVLWKEEHERWGLLCSLAACVDAPLGALVFGLLWCIGWLPRAGGQRARWRLGRGFAANRARGHLQAVFWFALGMLPLWPQFWAQTQAAQAATFALWFANQQILDARFVAASLVQRPWTLPVFLIVGAWCWKKAARNTPPAKAISSLAWCAAVLVIVAAWLLQSQLTGVALSVLIRAAPLAATLSIIAMARCLERGAARRGSLGFLLLWLWAGVVVFFGSTFSLVVGVLLIELINLLARRSSQRTRPTKIHPWLLRTGLPLRGRDVGRWALITFVLIFCWRGRNAVGERLQGGGGLFSRPQPYEWAHAQLWARKYTPPSAVFLSAESGFRTFSNRSVYQDSRDIDFLGLSTAYTNGWENRSMQVVLLWEIGSSAAEDVEWLRELRAAGVTHVVLPYHPLPPGNPPLRRIYANREWAIYKLR